MPSQLQEFVCVFAEHSEFVFPFYFMEVRSYQIHVFGIHALLHIRYQHIKLFIR